MRNAEWGMRNLKSGGRNGSFSFNLARNSSLRSAQNLTPHTENLTPKTEKQFLYPFNFVSNVKTIHLPNGRPDQETRSKGRFG